MKQNSNKGVGQKLKRTFLRSTSALHYRLVIQWPSGKKQFEAFLKPWKRKGGTYAEYKLSETPHYSLINQG